MKDPKKSFISNPVSSGSGKQKIKQISLNVYLNGRSFSGKTCIVQQLMTKKFAISAPPSTQQHFHCNLHSDELVENESFKVDIWDLGGCDQFKPIRTSTFKNDTINKVCLIVYDVSQSKTFEAAEGYIEEWMSNTKPADRDNMVLVANKIDMGHEGKRVVSPEQGIRLAEKYNIIYMECSAKENVEHIFTAAYLLKCSQSAMRVELMDEYLRRQQSEIEQMEVNEQYASKECILIRQLWQSKIGTIVAALERKLNSEEMKIIKAQEGWLQELKQFLVETIQYNELMADMADLKVAKEIMDSTMCEDPSIEDSVLSNSPATVYVSYDNLLQKLSMKCNTKHKLIQQQIQSRSSQAQTKISKQKTLILERLGEIVTLCLKDDDIEKFVKQLEHFDVKGIQEGQAEARSSVEVLSIVRKSININNCLNPSEIKQEYTRLQCSVIKEQKLINQLVDVAQEIITTVENLEKTVQREYEDIMQDPYFETSPEQFITKIIDFYVKNNAEDLLGEIDEGSAKNQKALEFVRKKIEITRIQFGGTLQVLFEKIRKIMASLTETTIASLERRRKLKIKKQYYNVLKFWHNLTREESKKENKSESKIGSLFNKIFGNNSS